jgi:hypothetical protein
LLLAYASAFILRSESRGTQPHILFSQIRDSLNLEARSPYFYPPGTRWPSYTPRHGVPFPSPFTTPRSTVVVIRTGLHTLGGQSAMPWRINSKRTDSTAPYIETSSYLWKFLCHKSVVTNSLVIPC